MAEDWEAYLTRVEGHPASVFCDLGLQSIGSEPQRPWRVRVSFPLQSPGPDGLSTSDESSALYAIEDRLFETVCRKLRCRYVGRVTTQGRRTAYYYGANADGISETLAGVQLEYPHYPFHISVEEDAAWRAFHEQLAPDDFALQTIYNRRLVESLKQSGDHGHQPRIIDHWAYFPSPEAREKFVTQVESEGFTVEYLEPGPESPTELPFGVHLTRSDRTALEHIDPLVADLYFRCQASGGKYDGWGTAVQTDEA